MFSFAWYKYGPFPLVWLVEDAAMRINYIELLIYVVRSGVAFLKLSQLCLHVVPKTGILWYLRIFEGPSIEKEEDIRRQQKTKEKNRQSPTCLWSTRKHVHARPSNWQNGIRDNYGRFLCLCSPLHNLSGNTWDLSAMHVFQCFSYVFHIMCSYVYYLIF